MQQKMVIDILAEQMNFNIITVREPPRSLQHEGLSFASSRWQPGRPKSNDLPENTS